MSIFDIDYTKPTYKRYKGDPEPDTDLETIELLGPSDRKMADDLYKSVADSSSFSDSPGEDMDGDMGADELELSNMGEEPLSEGFVDGLLRKLGDADFKGLGGGGGGKEEKTKISQITGASDPTRGSSNSFTPVANPYTAGLPKYLQSSGNYSQLANKIFGLLTPVRPPNISSLV